MSEKFKPLYEAIPSAMADVKILGKSDRNKFDGYDFVSIDKFLALINPICATHGLSALPSMIEVETYENTNSKGTKSTWAKYLFEITLSDTTGTSITSRQYVCVPLNGAQASGSAQSYALKQFWRALLCIPTGDKDDADLLPTEQHQAPSQPTEEDKAAKRMAYANGIATKLREQDNIGIRAELIDKEKANIAKLKSGDADAYQVIKDAAQETRTHLPTEE